MSEFSYNQAFSRNLGWLTDSEAAVLKTKTVAIAGMGGVGGQYCITLARLGICNFKISDFDEFEVHNFNRQHASNMNSIGRKKADVIKEEILSVNPDASVEIFPDGIHDDNITQFLTDVDIYLDGLDIFSLDIRVKLFKALHSLGIPGVTAGPLGMGTALMVFDKNSMSFDSYFGLDDEPTLSEKMVTFMTFLAPAKMQLKYLVDKSRIDVDAKNVPSTPMGVVLCSGVTCSTCLKILLGRGPLQTAPWSLHYDAYLNRYKKSYVIFGRKNPLMSLKLWIIKRIFLKANK